MTCKECIHDMACASIFRWFGGEADYRTQNVEKLCNHFEECSRFAELPCKDPNPYWDNVCAVAEKQRAKGIATYGQGIEMNPADAVTRVEYLQEELIDALMYCEWIKDSIKRKEKQ